jgi:L-aminopeptidase/D-esterase-like protein
MKRNNLITDVAGIRVGNAHDSKAKTGVTVVLCDEPSVASCHVMGGAPGTRDTDLLDPANTVDKVDAICLSGGSAFGLDAASGVQAALREKGRGFVVGDQRVPIVPGAILFDLINGGNKEWGKYPPYRELGYNAASHAARWFDVGSTGAGHGALVAGLKGGLGSASMTMASGITIGALAAVNALGSPVIGNTGHFHAALFEKNSEFGGLDLPAKLPAERDAVTIKFREAAKPGTNTTIAVIATDAELTKSEAKRLAVVAHDGFARALWPSHTPFDGDIVFAVATGTRPRPADMNEWIDLCALSSAVMARAIARGIYEAIHCDNDLLECWQEKFGAKKLTKRRT